MGYPEDLRDWERESFVRGYEQDAVAGERRLEDLRAAGAGDSIAAKEAQQQIDNARRELRRLGIGQQETSKIGQENAEKRPQRAREKRA